MITTQSKVTIKNPYLDEFKAYPASIGSSRRNELVKKFAWAIPDQNAVEIISRYSPIIELGAGSGYWAYMITQAGGRVCCFDNHSYIFDGSGQWMYAGNNYHHVTKGGPEVLSDSAYSDHALMLCWPDYATDFAYQALKAFSGKTVIYIGEGDGGCTGDQDFHELLSNDFKLDEYIHIPQYHGIHDDLMIYSRNGEA